MTDIETIQKRNGNPEMHSVLRVPGARGQALLRTIAKEREDAEKRKPRKVRGKRPN
jgi:hypothetical protein